MRNFSIFFILIIGLLLSGCQNTDSDLEEKLTIYTSVYPIQYIVEQLGQNTLDAHTIFPPGVDAHSFEPTTKMMTTIAKSDAFIYMGGGMEGFSETIADALKNEDVELVELGTHEELFETTHSDQPNLSGDHEQADEHNHEIDHDGHHHGEHDPHIWIDPLRMIEMAHFIMEELIEISPSQAALYENNYRILKEDLLELDTLFVETLENKTQTKILVSHAAFGYWEDRYGLEQLSINGISSTVEPSQKDLISIITQAKEYNFNYVIFEQNTSSKVSTIIQDYIHADSLTIHNLAVLTEEDLKSNEDYITLMKKNLHILDQATQ